MKPLRIEVEGFMAYRKPVTVDLSEVDLFALTGPTGSGKSTIIDAMVFALYGKTPRFGGHAPGQVINASSDWGRVRFSFRLGDVEYSVARRIERDRGVTEASLTSDDTAIAAGSKDVGRIVPQILGLEYDHFVRAVVLPQGKFARFVSDKPSERQDLLRALLDIGLYEQVKVLANQRAKVAESAITSARERLQRLDDVTPEGIEAAERQLSELEAAGKEAAARIEDIERQRASVTASEEALASLEARLIALVTTEAPEDVDGIGRLRQGAQELMDVTGAAMKNAASHLERLRGDLERLPQLAELHSWRDKYERRALLLARLGDIDLGRLEDLCHEQEKSLSEAQSRFDELHIANAAHALRVGLREGDQCPVCAQTVAGLPVGDPTAEDDLQLARSVVDECEARVRQARSNLDKARGEVETIEVQVDDLTERLKGVLDRDEVENHLAAVGELSAAVIEAEETAAGSQSAFDKARTELARIEKMSVRLHENLIAAAARLAAEEPPEPGEDPIAGWERFEDWRRQTAARLEADRAQATEMVEALRSALGAESEELDRILGGVGLAGADDPKTAVAVAHAKQEQLVARLQENARQASELEAEIDTAATRHSVASALGEHLKANKFEAWLLEEAMRTLVQGSNDLLETLSAGAYSLQYSDRSFDVIDHFNADQVRSTQSLSGGETFLVSLSLSLAMASQLVELSGARTSLESVFLDEGFGTLDAESLDVVDSVLNELAGQGRTVGIVTHVRDLADRMPTRFEVSKGPDGASIDEAKP